MKSNIVLEKSYDFSLRVIKMYLYLKKKRFDNYISNQVLRSGTSIGANIEEAMGASSKKDFINKFCISHKEARETYYWLRLLKDSKVLEDKISESMLSDCDELIKLTGKIISTSRKN